MPNIEIYNLPNYSGTMGDDDFFHIAQSSSDKRVKFSELVDEFGVMNIYGLSDIASLSLSNYVALGLDSDPDNNRRVTVNDIGITIQDPSLYTTVSGLTLDDEVVFRDDDGVASRLYQATMQDVRDRTLDLTNLFTQYTSPITTDRYYIYDVTNTEGKFITSSDMQQSALKATNLNTVTTLDNDNNYFITYDNVTGEKKANAITFSSLSSLLGGDVTEAGDNTFTGNNIFELGITLGDTTSDVKLFTTRNTSDDYFTIDNNSSSASVNTRDLIVVPYYEGTTGSYDIESLSLGAKLIDNATVDYIPIDRIYVDDLTAIKFAALPENTTINGNAIFTKSVANFSVVNEDADEYFPSDWRLNRYGNGTGADPYIYKVTHNLGVFLNPVVGSALNYVTDTPILMTVSEVLENSFSVTSSDGTAFTWMCIVTY